MRDPSRKINKRVCNREGWEPGLEGLFSSPQRPVTPLGAPEDGEAVGRASDGVQGGNRPA